MLDYAGVAGARSRVQQHWFVAIDAVEGAAGSLVLVKSKCGPTGSVDGRGAADIGAGIGIEGAGVKDGGGYAGGGVNAH